MNEFNNKKIQTHLWADRVSRKNALLNLHKTNSVTIDMTDAVLVNEQDFDNIAKLIKTCKSSGLSLRLINVSAAIQLALSLTGALDLFKKIQCDEFELIQRTAEKSSASTQTGSLISVLTIVGLCLVVVSLAGCVPRSNLFKHGRHSGVDRGSTEPLQSFGRYSMRCTAELNQPSANITPVSAAIAAFENAEPLFGSGDVVRIDITEGTEFAGTYAINLDGTLILPYAGKIRAKGRTATELSKAVEQKLITGGYFKSNQFQVTVLPLRWAPAQINISGAVFSPGRALINEVPAERRDTIGDADVGDAPTTRYLDAGLRGGAGVRPDADLANIELIRGNQNIVVDMTGIITGDGAPDIALMSGDKIRVPSSGCFHAELMRPSQITPAGMRVFMSNLTLPAASNTASSIERYATNLPLGTKLLQGAVSANCVGGADVSNAHRSIVLVSTNPITGKSEVIERRVEDLLRNPNRDDINPYLLPNDAVACYDSGVTNFREAARTLTDVLGPLGVVLGVL